MRQSLLLELLAILPQHLTKSWRSWRFQPRGARSRRMAIRGNGRST